MCEVCSTTVSEKKVSLWPRLRLLSCMKHIIFPLLLLLGAVACQKPILEPHARETFAEIVRSAAPLVGKTSLEDTLPAQVIRELGIGQVNGVKLQYGTSRYTSYYAYNADPDKVIAALSRLPFTKYAVVADTTCYQSSFEVLAEMQQGLSDVELKNGAFFWNAPREEFEVYECLKTPARHTVLINRRLGLVYHRIENRING